MPPLHPILQELGLGEEIPNGIMTWIKVDMRLGHEVGSSYEIVCRYEPRWRRYNWFRRMWAGRVLRPKYLLAAWLIEKGVPIRLVRFTRLTVSSKPLPPDKSRYIVIYVYSDADLSGEMLCKLMLYDNSKRRGGRPVGQVQDKSNNFREMMDTVANQYPGFMLGVPWANSFLVPIKRLIKPDMWGVLLAVLALAWNACNEWIR